MAEKYNVQILGPDSKEVQEENKKRGAAKASFPLSLVGFILTLIALYFQFIFIGAAWYPLFWIFDIISICVGCVVYITSIILCSIGIAKSSKGKGFPFAAPGKGFGIAGLILAILGLILNVLAAVLAFCLFGLVVTGAIVYLIFVVILAATANTNVSMVLAAPALLAII